MSLTVFELNGRSVRAGGVDPHCTLLEWLRASGLTGTKEGCAEGECGACAVAIVKRDASGRAYFQATNSCLVPFPEVHGQRIVTVEGVAADSGELHPVQRGMLELGGSQCGYCTPGFVVSLFCEYYRPGRLGYDPEAISGNLCRCTGYRPIVDVAKGLPQPQPGDPWLERLSHAAGPLPAVAHVAGEHRFLRPGTLAEATALLEQHPDATLIAGGTDLMVYSNQRYQRYSTLIALDALPELERFEWGPSEIVIGAGLSLSEVEERLAQQDPLGELGLLLQLFPLFSSRLIRNRATLGGNLLTASPIGDSLPVLLALDAELTLASAEGVRRVPLASFFLDYRKTAQRAGEIAVSVHVRRPLPRVQRFYKASKRVLDDISTVAAAFALDLDASGNVQRLRLAYGGVAATPVRAYAAEELARGLPWNESTLALLLEKLEAVGTPLGDHRGSAAYRRALIGKLLARFFADSQGLEAAAE